MPEEVIQNGEKYPSVEEYFKEEYPDLAGSLNNRSHFWERVKNNSIPNEDLERIIIRPEYSSRVYQASVALLRGRRNGRIAEPD